MRLSRAVLFGLLALLLVTEAPANTADRGVQGKSCLLSLTGFELPVSARVPRHERGSGVEITRFPFAATESTFQANASSVQEMPALVSREMEKRIADLRTVLPEARGARIGLNLAGSGSMEVVTAGLDATTHAKIIEFLRERAVFPLFLAVPPKFRNKYFEITVSTVGQEKSSVAVAHKFSWEIPIEFRSQLLTGFGEKFTDVVIPYEDGFGPDVQIRADLLRLGLSQETGATCALGSFCQVMAARGNPVTEWTLMREANAVKSEFDIVAGADPGVSLAEFLRIMAIYKEKTGSKFTVQEHIVRDDEGLNEFRAWVQKAADEANGIDVIVNLWSPTIGRLGTGHFLPIGGYNPKTDYVLMSETNLAFNKVYWLYLPQLYKSMMSDANSSRGYIIMGR